MDVTKLSTKGQVVIPESIRKRLKLKRGDCFTVETRGKYKVILERLIPWEEVKQMAEARRGAK